MVTQAEILREIEMLRSQLHRTVGAAADMSGEAVLTISREMDRLINKYYLQTRQNETPIEKAV